jgi:hypothetical protein
MNTDFVKDLDNDSLVELLAALEELDKELDKKEDDLDE